MNKIVYTIISKIISPQLIGIYIHCCQYAKVIDIDTNVHVFKDEWSAQDELVVNNPNSRKLNQLIRKTLYQLEGFELDYNGDFTLSKLHEIWEGLESTHDFYTMMDYQISNRDIREGTQEIHRRVLKHLRTYQPECNVCDLTESYVKGFIRYMKEIQLNSTTIAMHIHTLRCYYNIARKLFGDKVPADSFSFYHETKEQQINFRMQPLTDDDVRLLENYISSPSTPKKHVAILERFLFMTYTGLRISDFCSLSEKNITEENGKMWLSYTSVKTTTDVRIPLSCIFDGRAEQIIVKHRDDLESFFGIEKEAFNPKLKTACKHAGLNKRVSAHTARHTCASRLVNRDVPVTTIQKVIGHRTLRMTMVYAKTNEETLIRQLS